MNMKSTKKREDIVLDGITADIEISDGVVDSVTLRDRVGGILVIRKSDYAFKVLVPATPKLVRRYEITGVIRGRPFTEHYKYENAALERVKEIGAEADPLEMKNVMVEEDE